MCGIDFEKESDSIEICAVLESLENAKIDTRTSLRTYKNMQPYK